MKACRTCLSRYDLSPLFDDFSVVKFSSDQLFLVTGVKIAPNDGLPQSACRKCIKIITRALDLREVSIKADQMLRIIAQHKIIQKTEQKNLINTQNTIIIQNNLNTSTLSSNNEDVMSNDDFTILYENNQSNDINLFDFNIDSSLLSSHDKDKQLKKKNSKCKVKITKMNKNYNNSIDSMSNDEYFSTDDKLSDTKVMNKIYDVIKQENEDIEELYESKVINKIYDDIKRENLNLKMKSHNKVTQNISQNVKMNATNKSDNEINIINSEICKETDKVIKVNSNKNKTLHKEILEKKLSRKIVQSNTLSNFKMENYFSKEEINKLFNDEDYFQKNTCDKPNRLSIDQNRLNDGSKKNQHKIIDEKDNYYYFGQNENGEKVVKQNTNQKLDYFKEQHKKLMALATIPYNPKGPIQCKLCNKKLRNVYTFRTHAKSHFEPEFSCEDCGKEFRSKNHMQYHQQRRHGKEKRLACPICSFRAVDKATLQNHERLVHTGSRPYECAECGATFRMRGLIVQHMARHFGVKHIQCEFCPALFTRRSQLWSHQNKVHFLTYTYHCYICTETYKGALPVKRHLAAVHGVPLDQQLKIQRVVTKKDGAPNSACIKWRKTFSHES